MLLQTTTHFVNSDSFRLNANYILTENILSAKQTMQRNYLNVITNSVLKHFVVHH